MSTSDQNKPERQWRTLAQVIDERPWLTERWLRRMVAEKRIEYSKVGGRLLFDLAVIDGLAEQGRVEPRGARRSGAA